MFDLSMRHIHSKGKYILVPLVTTGAVIIAYFIFNSVFESNVFHKKNTLNVTVLVKENNKQIAFK